MWILSNTEYKANSSGSRRGAFYSLEILFISNCVLEKTVKNKPCFLIAKPYTYSVTFDTEQCQCIV